MRRTLNMGMAAVLAQTLVLSGMAGVAPPERQVRLHDPWDDENDETRKSQDPIIKSGARYEKAEAKRQRKAAKRLK